MFGAQARSYSNGSRCCQAKSVGAGNYYGRDGKSQGKKKRLAQKEIPDGKSDQATSDSHNDQIFGKAVGNFLPRGFGILGGFDHFDNSSKSGITTNFGGLEFDRTGSVNGTTDYFIADIFGNRD